MQRPTISDTTPRSVQHAHQAAAANGVALFAQYSRRRIKVSQLQ